MTTPQERARSLQRAQNRARIINALDQSHRDRVRATVITACILIALVAALVIIITSSI